MPITRHTRSLADETFAFIEEALREGNKVWVIVNGSGATDRERNVGYIFEIPEGAEISVGIDHIRFVWLGPLLSRFEHVVPFSALVRVPTQVPSAQGGRHND